MSCHGLRQILPVVLQGKFLGLYCKLGEFCGNFISRIGNYFCFSGHLILRSIAVNLKFTILQSWAFCKINLFYSIWSELKVNICLCRSCHVIIRSCHYQVQKKNVIFTPLFLQRLHIPRRTHQERADPDMSDTTVTRMCFTHRRLERPKPCCWLHG